MPLFIWQISHLHQFQVTMEPWGSMWHTNSLIDRKKVINAQWFVLLLLHLVWIHLNNVLLDLTSFVSFCSGSWLFRANCCSLAQSSAISFCCEVGLCFGRNWIQYFDALLIISLLIHSEYSRSVADCHYKHARLNWDTLIGIQSSHMSFLWNNGNCYWRLFRMVMEWIQITFTDLMNTKIPNLSPNTHELP